MVRQVTFDRWWHGVRRIDGHGAGIAQPDIDRLDRLDRLGRAGKRRLAVAAEDRCPDRVGVPPEVAPPPVEPFTEFAQRLLAEVGRVEAGVDALQRAAGRLWPPARPCFQSWRE